MLHLLEKVGVRDYSIFLDEESGATTDERLFLFDSASAALQNRWTCCAA